jgi:hypothetical protein
MKIVADTVLASLPKVEARLANGKKDNSLRYPVSPASKPTGVE